MNLNIVRYERDGRAPWGVIRAERSRSKLGDLVEASIRAADRGVDLGAQRNRLVAEG